ncbi:hypothetical protein Patl1_12408 [Pistacia atlantica]|uniref:Uncharacterized protein n=1 Tax=Pistacia atlantica TaxID=434234 RepID=A0ACC1A879_9ROSI|nr:hypothetical protein Patl1_12408 [Pistacia atlantica]
MMFPSKWISLRFLLQITCFAVLLKGLILLKMELVLAVLILACLHSTVQSDYQGDALYALKNSLHVSSTLLTDWNQNQVNPCTWSNVICDNSNTVVSVTLSTMNFSGTLSPRIGVLRNLKEMYVWSVLL